MNRSSLRHAESKFEADLERSQSVRGEWRRWLLALTAAYSITLVCFALALSIIVHFRTIPNKTSLDLVDLLFGSASLALFIFSFLFSFAAFFGWQSLRERIRTDAEEAVENSMKANETNVLAALERMDNAKDAVENSMKANETKIQEALRRLDNAEPTIQGRLLNGLGYLLGEMHSNPDSLVSKETEPLETAVELCRSAYLKLLHTTEGAKLNSLNNLVYYSSVLEYSRHRNEAEKSAPEATWLREQAHLLKIKGEEFDVARLLLTYCRFIIAFPSSDRDRQEALKIVGRLLSRTGKLSGSEAREAQLYSKSLSATPPP